MGQSDLKDALASLRIDRESEPARGGAGRWVIAAVVAVALVALGVFLLRPRAVPVRTARVVEPAGDAGGAAAVLNASGYVTARRQATVSSKITGKVVEIDVEEGMAVAEGQVLARLDDAQARLSLELTRARRAAAEAALAEIEALLREARLRHGRTVDLAERQIAARADVDATEAETGSLAARLDTQRRQVEVARREEALAQQNLDDTVIRAPFAGVAISKNAQPGEMISPISAGGGFTRTGISTIVDMSSLEIEVDVNEAYIQRVEPGQRVRATLDAYPDWPIEASVITTIPAAERDKATVKVRIAFAGLDPRILPDMGVKVAFLGDETEGGAPRALRVPRAALRGATGSEQVLVVDDEGRLERRAVRVAAGGSDPAEVLAGLAVGERVVVEGPADLAAGDRVVERERD
ncbi:MAG TPA: efflux RND transporter periplasmic adaptor subunit [Thermoanaerobaculia bacterium]|nr:efflux RND transporter periplasmic adaptor subunit [Thermoanaerobaculia bacterium]